MKLSPLSLAAVLIAGVLAVPLLVVLASVFDTSTADTWAHLSTTVLPEYVSNTAVLVLMVALGAGSIGVVSAWLTAMLDFPGRRIFEWALILPLAMPAYVMAYLYTDLLQFVGPLQSGLRDYFGWQRSDYWFPEIRSLGGACVMFSFVLYPYVYMLTRVAFLERGRSVNEAARSLGLSPWASFWHVSLPIARPAIVAGVALALMETLADYGTVAYFAVQTFTTGIYRAWFSLGDRMAAAQLSASLLAVVALLLALERFSRGGARHAPKTGAKVLRKTLSPGAGALACLACALPLLFGFVLPAILLVRMALSEGDAQFGLRYFALVKNSISLASISAALAVIIACLLAYAARLSRHRLPQVLNRLAGLGYAVPGSVIAVGVLIPVTRLDLALGQLWQWLGGAPTGLLLTGGIAALVYAYLVRFLTVALSSVEAGLARITPAMEQAAQSLGSPRGEVLRRVHWPLLRGSLLTAGLVVFVDVMKELPATLVMRPFNFDTLATQTYTLAADERLAEAATAALAIVAVGLVPVILLSRRIARA